MTAPYSHYETLAFERRGRVLCVTLNRPETRNAISPQLHRELASVFYDIARDDECDVVVLTGAGKSFCAGGDANSMQEPADAARLRAIIPESKRIIFGMLELEKPVICRLNGAAAGFGATLALLCDVIVAADHAVIGDPHVKMGVVAGDGGALIWPQLIGYARAKEFLMTGELITAARAEQIGLINYAVPADQLDAKVWGLADGLANGATLAIRWTKTVANMPLRKLAQELMDASLAYETMCAQTEDHQEAVAAFLEKRAPRFTGR